MGFTTILLVWLAATAAALVTQPAGSGSKSAELRGAAWARRGVDALRKAGEAAKARRKVDTLLKRVEAEVETEVTDRGSESGEEFADRVTGAELAKVNRFVDREIAREFGPEAVEHPDVASEEGRETEKALLHKVTVMTGQVASEAERHRASHRPAGDEEHTAMVSQILGRIADEARESDEELKSDQLRAAPDSAEKSPAEVHEEGAESTDEEEPLMYKKEVGAEDTTDVQDLHERQDLREQARADQLLGAIEAEVAGEMGTAGDTSSEAVDRLKSGALSRISARLESDLTGEFGTRASSTVKGLIHDGRLRRAQASDKSTGEILTRAQDYADRYARTALKFEARLHEARPVMDDEDRNNAVKDVLNSVAESMNELGMRADELKSAARREREGDSTDED